MAIDIRQLRIGAHILANGVRARIERLELYKWPDGKIRPRCYMSGIVDGEYRECGSFLDVDNMMPIAITPELLTELGFKEDEETGLALHIRKDEEYTVIFRQEGDHGWNCALYMSHRTCKIGNVRFIKYLHEAELFLALHNVELIKD